MWAVVLSALGLSRPGFPRGQGAERLVLLLSVVLVAGAMAAALLTA